MYSVLTVSSANKKDSKVAAFSNEVRSFVFKKRKELQIISFHWRKEKSILVVRHCRVCSVRRLTRKIREGHYKFYV